MPAAPLGPAYEKRPSAPLPAGHVPPGGVPYRVKNGDNWWHLATHYGYDDPWDLIYFNFQTRDPKEVNWYLRERVGCDTTSPDKKNWSFTSSAHPGVVHVPAEKKASKLSKALLGVWAGPGMTLGGSLGIGYRAGGFIVYNVEALTNNAPFPIRLRVELTIAGIGAALSVQSAFLIVTGAPDPSALHGLRATDRQMKFEVSDHQGTANAYSKRAIEILKNNLKTKGKFFSRQQAHGWFRSLGIDVDSVRPTVYFYATTAVGFDASVTVSSARIMVVG